MITHEEFIKKHNLKESYYYQENGWLYILKLARFSYPEYITIEELPSKIKFTEKCNHSIIIEKIKKIPPDVIFNNRGYVKIYYVEEISKNVIFNNRGFVELGDFVDRNNIGKLKKIHPSVKFINNGDVFLHSIINKIPSGIVFNNKWDVRLYYVEEISENVTFSNDGDLSLCKLKKVHPNVEFINKKDIYFDYGCSSKIPEGIIFNNKRNVKVHYIKEISENVVFNNDGDVEFKYQKVIFSKGVRFNNKGKIEDLPFLKNIPKFLDPKKYLNKMIEQMYK